MARIKAVLITGCSLLLSMYIYMTISKSNFKLSNANGSEEDRLHRLTERQPLVAPKLSFRKLSFGNITQFRLNYLMNNPFICSSIENLTFIVVVHTATENFNKRLGIRLTWANANHYKGFTMRTVFFIGRPTDKHLQPVIDEENRQFKDIVQGDFLDTYRNITYKGVMVYHWIAEYCSNAQMILKVDDDMFVNMFRIVQQHLPMLLKSPRQITCDVVKHGRIRRTLSDKWNVKPEELPGRTEYPIYCRGYMVLITPDLIVPMLKKVSLNPFFWIDDVYLYGLLPELLGVSWHNVVPQIPEVLEDCFQAYIGDRTKPHPPFVGCLNVPDRKKMVIIWEMALMNLPKSSFSMLRNYTFLSWILPP